MMKNTEVNIPMLTAFLAAFFPSISLMISVTRKVDANRIFPSVCSMPKAFTMISTSMLAVIVAMAVKQYNPLLPNSRYASSTHP